MMSMSELRCVLHVQCVSLQYELVLAQNTGRRVPWAQPWRTCTFPTFPCEHVGPRGALLPATGHPLIHLPIFKYLPGRGWSQVGIWIILVLGKRGREAAEPVASPVRAQPALLVPHPLLLASGGGAAAPAQAVPPSWHAPGTAAPGPQTPS